MPDISIKECAQLFNVSHMTIRRWLDKKVLKEGAKLSQLRTVKVNSCQQLLKDEKFMKGIKRDHKPKQQDPVAQDNSQLQKTLEEVLQNQRTILAEIANIKSTIFKLESSAKVGKQIEIKKASMPKKIVTAVSEDDAKFMAEAKSYIEKSIELGIPKSQIDTVNKGGDLIKWLRGEKPGTTIGIIRRWYDAAKELRGNGL